MVAISNAVLTNSVNPFVPLSATPGFTVSAATYTAVESALSSYNSAITAAAKLAGANVVVFDLKSLLHNVNLNGLTVGSTNLTASFMGGFYTLDGYYPGQTGQGYIANSILTLLNTTYGTNFPLVNLTTVSTSDPALQFRPSFVRRRRLVPLKGFGIMEVDK